MRIRPARPDDLDDVYRICLLTADNGRDATSLVRDPKLPGYVWAAPYLMFEPSLAFVATGVASSSLNNFAVSVGFGDVLAGDGQLWGAARMSATGTCYYITDKGADPDGNGPLLAGTFRNSGAGACTGTQALTYNTSDTTW